MDSNPRPDQARTSPGSTTHMHTHTRVHMDTRTHTDTDADTHIHPPQKKLICTLRKKKDREVGT